MGKPTTTLISMISGFSDVSPAPKPNYVYLWRHQGTQQQSGKSLVDLRTYFVCGRLCCETSLCETSLCGKSVCETSLCGKGTAGELCAKQVFAKKELYGINICSISLCENKSLRNIVSRKKSLRNKS